MVVNCGTSFQKKLKKNKSLSYFQKKITILTLVEPFVNSLIRYLFITTIFLLFVNNYSCNQIYTTVISFPVL